MNGKMIAQMSAVDAQDASNEHYRLDERVRMTLSRMTIEEKRKAIDQIEKLAEKNS